MNLPVGVTSRKVHTYRLETHILEHGDKTGEPVLLIHGNVSSNRFFDELLAAMPERFYAIAPDLRGYGESQSKPVDATRGVRDWTDDLEALVEALGLRGKKTPPARLVVGRWRRHAICHQPTTKRCLTHLACAGFTLWFWQHKG